MERNGIYLKSFDRENPEQYHAASEAVLVPEEAIIIRRETMKGRVYCAGPLFTEKEQEEMSLLAHGLEEDGFETFLPQRDGLELTKCIDALVSSGLSNEESGQLMSEAIFALDVYQVLHGCDVVVANLNGRVPDEGTVSEAAMAWARGKVVVGYKADMRSAFSGQDNPLVSGLFDFRLCQTFDDVVVAVNEGVQKAGSASIDAAEREHEIMAHSRLGSEISSALENHEGLAAIVNIIVDHKSNVQLVGWGD